MAGTPRRPWQNLGFLCFHLTVRALQGPEVQPVPHLRVATAALTGRWAPRPASTTGVGRRGASRPQQGNTTRHKAQRAVNRAHAPGTSDQRARLKRANCGHTVRPARPGVSPEKTQRKAWARVGRRRSPQKKAPPSPPTARVARAGRRAVSGGGGEGGATAKVR